jgi:hypothetical protein
MYIIVGLTLLGALLITLLVTPPTALVDWLMGKSEKKDD